KSCQDTTSSAGTPEYRKILRLFLLQRPIFAILAASKPSQVQEAVSPRGKYNGAKQLHRRFHPSP
ncbi:MAG TPA: hypothetical protein PL005_11160, partial [Candidatus Hydrogenedentes bacterium]|nr:hypothetical protein [Candidatus Hydrogenedentota bacterium]